MKKLLIIFSLLFSLNALSQTPVPFSSLTLYTGSLDSVKYVGLIKAGNVWANRVFYGIDLVKGRLNISDTAAMLANYYAAIVQKVNISDTAAMLSPYQRSAALVANYYSKTQSDGRYLQSVDSSNIPNFFLKVRAGLSLVAITNNYNDLSNKPTIPASQVNSDWNAVSGVAQILNKPSIPAAQVNSDWTASSGLAQILNKPSYLDSFNLSTRANRQKGIDSIISLNYLKTAVTAVNAGYGISGGNITATGTHSVDSFSLASRAYAQKIKDSLQANINGKLSSAVTSVATGYGLSGGTIINTGTLVADSFSLASRARVQKGIDSLQGNINAKGTVNSVATGFGLTGGTITNSGTLLTDSFSVASRARVQKAVDSLNANIATKQATLVNQTNIKSINGTSLLGSGDLVVGGSVDTFSISTRAFRDKLKDSLQANINTNTTAIGTKMANWIAGYGLTGGTISDGQTSKADSFSIATRAYAQKIKDSLQVNITTNTTAIAGKQPLTTVATGLTAAGSTQGTALVLSGNNSLQEITTAASGTGVQLPTPTTSSQVTIVNRGANAIIVYPVSSGVINGQSANAGYTVGVNNSVTFYAKSTSAWYTDDNFQGGDVASTDANSNLTIGSNKVTYAKFQQVGANSILGNNTGSAANAIELTSSQVKTFLAIAESDVSGLTTDLAAKMASWTAGFGLTGGTISNGNTSIVDSFSVASRARVQKAVDSLNGVLPNSTNALNIAGVNFSFGGPGTQRSWSIGVSLPGQVAQMTAASSAINTTETKLMNTASIAANQLTAGSTYTVVLYGTCTSTVANASNIRVRIGTAGTTSDAVVGLITPTAATSGTGVNFTCTFTLKVRTTGVSGTMAGNGFLMNNGTTGISSVADVVGTVQSITVNTTAANIISVWYVSAATTTTSTFQDGIIKCEKI